MKNNWTHERISRKAEAYQWNGENTDQVLDLLARHGMIGELFRDNQYIQVYHEQSYDSTLRKSDWLLVGEDSVLRFYPDEKFRLMYQSINDELERLKCEIERLKVLERQGLENFNLLLQSMQFKAGGRFGNK